ncbi:MAG: sigma-54 dependent transcriptional regulator, partial [Planctomycetales bacterium]
LSDGDGFRLLEQTRSKYPSLSVILTAERISAEDGVRALRSGASDLLAKPTADADLLAAIGRATTPNPRSPSNGEAASQPDADGPRIIARDPKMRQVFETVDQVADSRCIALLTGESGTGKSLIAREMHQRSARRNQPFVEVACGGLPDALLESELFGHVRGAFTGAVAEKTGRFQQADGGTIFLDEIGTATLNMQIKLLRVLESFAFEPVGSTETVHVDARVILATNENLGQLVAQGRFRQDLFYRINVINIELPSLRERVADVPSLAEYFLDKFRRETGKHILGIAPDAMIALQSHPWPGNVREFRNVMERAVLLTRGEWIQMSDLPPAMVSHGAFPNASRGTISPTSRTLKQALEAPERRIILSSLEEHGWNRHLTAEALGVNRTTLYKKMKRLGLEENAPRRNRLPEPPRSLTPSF